MTAEPESKRRWSDELGRRLLSSLPRDARARLHRFAAGNEAETDVSRTRQFQEVLAAARGQPQLRRAIMQAWRAEHATLVSAAELVPIEGSLEQCERLLGEFDAEEIVLEMITDPRDDGWQLAEWVIDNLPSVPARRQLRALVEELSAGDEPTGPAIRIVVFGGHPRDESKMTRRLFARSPFQVRWRPCEKSQGSPDEKALLEAMRGTDGVILVTSMVSHNIMRIVKRYIQDCDLPWKAVTKATDAQLKAALAEMFPDGTAS